MSSEIPNIIRKVHSEIKDLDEDQIHIWLLNKGTYKNGKYIFIYNFEDEIFKTVNYQFVLTYEDLKLLSKNPHIGKGKKISLKAFIKRERCSICMSRFKLKKNMTILKCKHKFHDDCITQWFNKSVTCPICRSNMLNTKVGKLENDLKITKSSNMSIEVCNMM